MVLKTFFYNPTPKRFRVSDAASDPAWWQSVHSLNMNTSAVLAGIGVKSRFEVTEEKCQNSYSFCSLCLTDKISY